MPIVKKDEVKKGKTTKPAKQPKAPKGPAKPKGTPRPRLGIAAAAREFAGRRETVKLTEVIEAVAKKLGLEISRVRAAIVAHVYGRTDLWKKVEKGVFKFKAVK
jgi:hypothetical protein